MTRRHLLATFCSVENLRRLSSQEALGNPELLNTKAFFFPKGRKWFLFIHLEGRSGCCQTTWWSFAILWSKPLLESSKILSCFDPNPELCLSVNRTLPYERGLMYFASFNNKSSPYTCYKSFLLTPLPWLSIEVILIAKVRGAFL